MSCLKGYIGLKQCDTSPRSGRYLNELAGISTEMVNSISNEEQVNFEGVFKDIESRAVKRLEHDFLIMSRSNKGYFKSPWTMPNRQRLTGNNIIPGVDTKAGVFIHMPTSNLLKARVTGFIVNSSAAFEAPVIITDIIDAEIENPITLSINGSGYKTIKKDSAGADIKIEIPIKYDGQEYFVGIDLSGVEATLKEIDRFSYRKDFCGCDGNHYENYLEVTSSFDNEGSMTKAATALAIPIIEFYCDSHQFICENERTFEEALLYLLGHELLEEKSSTHELSIFTYYNEEKTQENSAIYEAKYKAYLKNAIENIDMIDSVCIGCNEVGFVSQGTLRV